jgi:hypothetical protein
MNWRVWFHRSRSIAWMVVGALSFPFGWAHSIVLVWIASLYANVASDWSASEAADDRAVLVQPGTVQPAGTAAATVAQPAQPDYAGPGVIHEDGSVAPVQGEAPNVGTTEHVQ